MCFGNTQTGSETTSENMSKTMAPWLENAAQQNLQFAQGVQNTPTTPYNYQRVAGIGSLGADAYSSIQNLLKDFNNNPDFNTARGMFTGYANAGPQSVNAPQIGAQPGVAPRGVLTNIDDYMSKYTGAALNPTIRNINTTYAAQRTGPGGIGSAATSSGAYGDSRHALLESENMKNEGQAVADATAQAYDRAFTQGAGLSQYDTTNQLNADTFNATQNLQRLFQNAGLNMQGQMANAGFAEQALSRMLGGGNALAGLGSSNMSQLLSAIGLGNNIDERSRAINQSGLDAAYQDWLRVQNDPFMRSQVGNAALGISTPAASWTGSGTKTKTSSAPNNSGWSLAGSIAGAALPFLLSDRRLKTDIKKVGRLNNKLPVYSYRYKFDPTATTHIGVMAQEVEKTNPDAVHTIAGFKAVDYDLATAA